MTEDDALPQPTLPEQAKRLVVGRPRDRHDRNILHRLSLIPFLPWVGLDADGLSSPSHGPQSAFGALAATLAPAAAAGAR